MRIRDDIRPRVRHEMPLYVGCPVWSFKGWVGNFYPEGTQPSDYLREYARRLTTIEGNTTFYATPGDKVLQHWVVDTPESFRFCPKIPKSISHAGKLNERAAAAREFVDVLAVLGSRLGPMFLQLPPRYSPLLLDDLAGFLSAWPPQIRLAVEVRHHAWPEPANARALTDLLSKRGVARVVIDTRPIRSLEGDKLLSGTVYQRLLEARRQKPDLPVIPERTADFVFVRYIGHPQLAINEPLLEEWASHIADVLQRGSDAYVFCHSPDTMTAPSLCRELHARVRRRISIPALPWDDADKNAADQPRLI